MSDASSKSLTNILRPYYILSRVTGLRAFDKSRLKMIFSLSIPLLLGLHSIYKWTVAEIKSGTYKPNKAFHIVQFLYYGAYFLRSLTINSSIIVGILRGKTWEDTTRTLYEVNKTLETLGSKTRFRRIYIRTLIELVLLFIHIIISSAHFTIFYIKYQKDLSTYDMIILFFSFIYGEIADYTVTMDFLTFVRCIRSEVQRANDLLSDVNILPLPSIAIELIEDRKTDNSLFKKVFTIAPLLRRSNSQYLVERKEILRIRRLLSTIRRIHLQLNKTSKNLSTLYGIQMSFAMAMNIFYGTCFFYVLYISRHKLLTKNFFFTELFAMNLICIYVCGKIFLVNFTCDRATQDAKKTSEIIYTFYADYSDYEIQQECFGAIATYLVIMIQMTQQ